MSACCLWYGCGERDSVRFCPLLALGFGVSVLNIPDNQGNDVVREAITWAVLSIFAENPTKELFATLDHGFRISIIDFEAFHAASKTVVTHVKVVDAYVSR